MEATEKKPTLWQLQDRLLEFEEKLNADDANMTELIGEIADKIDGIKQMIDIFESEADRFKRYKDEMAARQKSLQAAAGRLKSYVVASLEKHDTTFEKGNIWVAKIRESRRVETFQDPDARTMIALMSQNLSCIKAEYAWDKVKLKEYLDRDHDPMLDNYAKMVTTKSINFSAVNAAARGKKND